MKMIGRSSRSFMLAVIGALAFAFCGLATATEPMKPSGFGSPVDAAAQAMPDHPGAPVAAVNASDHVDIIAQPGAKLAKCRTVMPRQCVSVKAGNQVASTNQNGIQADRGAKVRQAYS